MTTYIAYVEEAETEAMSFDRLKYLMLSKNLPGETPVRFSHDANWLKWSDIPAMQMQLAAGQKYHESAAQPQLTPAVTRDVVRERTAYPFLRGFGTFLIILSSVSAVVLWIVAFTVQSDAMGYMIGAAIAATLSIPFTIFSNGVAQAVVDIADKTISRD